MSKNTVRDAISFVSYQVIYCVIIFAWLLLGLADSDMVSIRASLPVIGELPPQSISKFVMSAALYLLALLYALTTMAGSEHRRALPKFMGFGVLTFLAWVALNYWAIAGFLNAAAVYGVVSSVLLVIWAGATMFFVLKEHDAMALFLVRFGLGLMVFISVVQILALFTPDWRTPTQGVPVLYTLTLNGLVGVFLAGAGGNMLWREKRAQLIAQASKKR